MRKTISTLLTGAAVLTPAFAQEQPDVPYDGKWSASVQADDGTRLAARVELGAFAGFWYGPVGTRATAGTQAGADARSSAKPVCKGRKFPITVQNSTASGLAFTVWGTAVSPACADLTVELTPVDEKALEGTVQSLGKMTLKRR